MKAIALYLCFIAMLVGTIVGMSLYDKKVTNDSLASLKQWQQSGGKVDCETLKYINQFAIYDEMCGEK